MTALTTTSLGNLLNLEIPDLSAYLGQLNIGLVPRVVAGELVWETDRAAAWDMIRARRDELLIEADYALNIIYDEARINQTQANPDGLRAIAETAKHCGTSHLLLTHLQLFGRRSLGDTIALFRVKE